MDLKNPQSINRYPYVEGTPINFTESLGLAEDDGCTLVNGTGGDLFGTGGLRTQFIL
jgi:hypothetical protein